MKTIDSFDRDDDETTVMVEVSTVGPVQVAVSTYNRGTGDRGLLLFTPQEAHRVGQALLKAAAGDAA